jgi:hypothetical protein
MLLSLLQPARCAADAGVGRIRRCLARWTKPTSGRSLVLGTVMDLARSKPELIAENALLRQQLIVLTHPAQRPRFTPADRALLVLLASRARAWRQALLIVQPETLLRWHRARFRLVWRWKSTPRFGQPKLPQATAALIKQMARENRLSGASVFGASYANSASQSASGRSRSTCGRRAHPDPAGRPGPRSCAPTRATSGHATSCKSSTYASDRCSPSWSSNWRRAGWSTWGSPVPPTMAGWRNNSAKRRPLAVDRGI